MICNHKIERVLKTRGRVASLSSSQASTNKERFSQAGTTHMGARRSFFPSKSVYSKMQKVPCASFSNTNGNLSNSVPLFDKSPMPIPEKFRFAVR